MKFADIIKAVPLEEISALYTPYHEMDIRHFVDKMNELCLNKRAETSLKRLRLQAGLSQRRLAEKSGISPRTIRSTNRGRRISTKLR